MEHDLFVPHCNLEQVKMVFVIQIPTPSLQNPQNRWFGEQRVLNRYHEGQPVEVKSSIEVNFEHDRRKLFIVFPYQYKSKSKLVTTTVSDEGIAFLRRLTYCFNFFQTKTRPFRTA